MREGANHDHPFPWTDPDPQFEEATEGEEGYVGIDVHRAARIAAVCRQGAQGVLDWALESPRVVALPFYRRPTT